jgi:hypothetical protein
MQADHHRVDLLGRFDIAGENRAAAPSQLLADPGARRAEDDLTGIAQQGGRHRGRQDLDTVRDAELEQAVEMMTSRIVRTVGDEQHRPTSADQVAERRDRALHRL